MNVLYDLLICTFALSVHLKSCTSDSAAKGLAGHAKTFGPVQAGQMQGGCFSKDAYRQTTRSAVLVDS